MNEMQAAHTPGPWKVKQGIGNWQFKKPAIEVSGQGGIITALVFNDGHACRELDAALIADAPRLKEVNEALLAAATQALAMLRQQGRGNGRTASVLEEAIARAREVQP